MTQTTLSTAKTDQLTELLTAGERAIELNPINLPGAIAQYVHDTKKKANTWMQELAIPTRRDEDWRFTDLSPLFQHQFEAPPPLPVEKLFIEQFILPEAENSRLVFINGVYSDRCSNLTGLPDGVFVGSIAQLPTKYHGKLSQYLAKQPGHQEFFTALNTIGLNDVAIIWVGKNQIIEQPIHLLFIASPHGQPMLSQRRCLVVAESGSSVSFIEHSVTSEFGCPDAIASHPYLNNTVTEIYVEENATVSHVRVQRDGGAAFNISKTAVSQSKDSRYTSHCINLGAKLSRHNFHIYQNGAGTETNLQGLTMIGHRQTADTHSAIILQHPHGVANQLHKCIVDDYAHAIFNGQVYVAQNAQLTEASQLNRNLLLSSKGRVDTKPQLEIIADNVKCSHGATVSQLEDDEIFYLQSRGIDASKGRNLLIDAFAAEILQELPIHSIQQMLARCVSCRI